MLKKSFKFSSWFVFFGLFFTIFDIYVMMAVSTPNVMAALTPKEVYEFYNFCFKICFEFVPSVFGGILFFLSIIGIIVLIFCFRTINPYFNFKVFANWRSVLKIILAIVYFIILASISVVIFIPDMLYQIMETNRIYSGDIMALIYNLTFDFLLFIILIFGISWFIFHKDGYIGDFIKPNFRSLRDIFRALKLFIWGGLLGFIISILIYLSGIAIDNIISFYIQGIDLDFYRFKILSSLFILVGLISWFLGGLIIYIFPKLRERTKEAMSSIILFLAIFILSTFSGLYLYNIAKTKYDYGKSLSNILDISEKPKTVRTILLFKDGKILIKESPLLAREEYYYLGIFKSFFREKFPSGGKGYLDANLKNIEKARDYLLRKNYDTNQLYNAYCYILQCYLMDWDIKSAMKVHYEIIQKTNNILHCMVMLARLYSSASKENLKWAGILSDEKRFNIGYAAAQRLGYIYWHYGKYDKAKGFYKLAKEKGYKPHRKEDKPKTKPVFTKGKVTGSIYINNKPAKNIKVGLVYKKIDIEKLTKGSFFMLRGEVSTTTTSSDGKFYFENVVDDNTYYLIIMADNSILPSDLNKLEFENKPGEVVISKNKPRADLGRVVIKVTL